MVPTYGTLGTAVSLHFTDEAFTSRLLSEAPETAPRLQHGGRSDGRSKQRGRIGGKGRKKGAGRIFCNLARCVYWRSGEGHIELMGSVHQ